MNVYQFAPPDPKGVPQTDSVVVILGVPPNVLPVTVVEAPHSIGARNSANGHSNPSHASTVTSAVELLAQAPEVV